MNAITVQLIKTAVALEKRHQQKIAALQQELLADPLVQRVLMRKMAQAEGGTGGGLLDWLSLDALRPYGEQAWETVRDPRFLIGLGTGGLGALLLCGLLRSRRRRRAARELAALE